MIAAPSSAIAPAMENPRTDEELDSLGVAMRVVVGPHAVSQRAPHRQATPIAIKSQRMTLPLLLSPLLQPPLRLLLLEGVSDRILPLDAFGFQVFGLGAAWIRFTPFVQRVVLDTSTIGASESAAHPTGGLEQAFRLHRQSHRRYTWRLLADASLSPNGSRPLA